MSKCEKCGKDIGVGGVGYAVYNNYPIRGFHMIQKRLFAKSAKNNFVDI